MAHFAAPFGTPAWKRLFGHLTSLTNQAQVALSYTTLDGRGDSTNESNDDDLESD